VFKATQLRHPAGIAGGACGSFVPNDICLGGDAPGFILLTGPNMGGKSTLLRQVCLAAVLAQVSKGAADCTAARGLLRLFQGADRDALLQQTKLRT
jgi:dsDNA-specific endonuclease/ATPase MutS2